MSELLTIAMPKGRIFEEAAELYVKQTFNCRQNLTIRAS